MTHHDNNSGCEVSFPNEHEFAKALEYLLYRSSEGYSGVGENTIIVSKNQCEELEKIEGLKFIHKNK